MFRPRPSTQSILVELGRASANHSSSTIRSIGVLSKRNTSASAPGAAGQVALLLREDRLGIQDAEVVERAPVHEILENRSQWAAQPAVYGNAETLLLGFADLGPEPPLDELAKNPFRMTEGRELEVRRESERVIGHAPCPVLTVRAGR